MGGQRRCGDVMPLGAFPPDWPIQWGGVDWSWGNVTLNGKDAMVHRLY